MADCFISYSTQDATFAQYIHSEMRRHELTPFMASLSLQPGVPWSTEIRRELQGSKWVIFLASRAACASAFVQQELGMALAGGKRIVPVVWEITPAELPGWIKETQALDLRGATPQQIGHHVSSIATTIKQDKTTALFIAAALVGAVLLFAGDG